jgi:ribosomal protein S18 acetylase RimI-like enzyme
MIKALDQSHYVTSEKIYHIFQISYAVEAALLKCDDFPPLNRSVSAIQNSTSTFYGYFDNSNLAAVMELEEGPDHIHIRSLTVDPEFFRRGIGFKLLRFIDENFPVRKITVETGNENYPAVDFYLNFGFKKNKVWMTDFGIEKVSFSLQKKSSRS